MICTCQGSSCSCIGKNDAHCIWEEDDKCIDLDAVTENGMNLHIKYHYMPLYSNALFNNCNDNYTWFIVFFLFLESSYSNKSTSSLSTSAFKEDQTGIYDIRSNTIMASVFIATIITIVLTFSFTIFCIFKRYSSIFIYLSILSLIKNRWNNEISFAYI